MLYRIYEFVHSQGIHFWDIPSVILLVAMGVIGIVHTVRQRQRDEDFEEELESKKRQGSAGEFGR